MTALAAPKGRKRLLTEPCYKLPVEFKLLAGAHLFPGSLAAVDTSARAQPAGATSTFRVIGVSEEDYDNTDGDDGDVTTRRIMAGTFLFANSSSSDLIANDDVRKVCYVVDDNTVAATSNSNARPVAGTVVAVDSEGVWVRVGVDLT